MTNLRKGSNVIVTDEYHRLFPSLVGLVGTITGESRNHAAWWLRFPGRRSSINLHKDYVIAATTERLVALKARSKSAAIVDLWITDDDAAMCVSRDGLIQSIADAIGATEWRFDLTAAPNSDKVQQPVLIAVDYGDGRRIVGEASYYAENNEWWWANERGEYHTEPIYPRPYAWRPLPLPPIQQGE